MCSQLLHGAGFLLRGGVWALIRCALVLGVYRLVRCGLGARGRQHSASCSFGVLARGSSSVGSCCLLACLP